MKQHPGLGPGSFLKKLQWGAVFLCQIFRVWRRCLCRGVTDVTQVVAGILYSFDLVTTGGCWPGHAASSCSMSVLSQPWTQTLQVNWGTSTCDRPE